MSGKSWISHYIVPCPGNSSCKHCKPGEPRPKQHMFSKLVRETNSPQIPSSLTSQIAPPKVEHEKYLRRHKLMGTSFGNLESVPFDPNVDPKPYACFICWSLLHMTRHCEESTTHNYCWNCGRKDVGVEECPRCAKAYREYREKRRCIEEDKRQFRNAIRKAIRSEEDLQDGDAELISMGKASGDSGHGDFIREDKQISRVKKEIKQEDKYREDIWDKVDKNHVNTSINSYENCKIKETVKCKDELWSDVDEKSHRAYSPTHFASSKKENTSLSSTPFVSQCSDDYSDSYNDYHNAESNELFTCMRNQKIQEQLEFDRIKSEVASNYFCESEYYFFDEEEQDENYEDYIVDEDDKSESLYSEGYMIRFFVDLLGALKHLSFDMQNTAVLNFVSARKKEICKQREMTQEDPISSKNAENLSREKVPFINYVFM